jgi:1-deoxy-D-xylulose-5-phosphate reductoisomerase
MPNIVVLGSTGSIGRAALEVAAGLGSEYRVVAIAARDSVDLLAEQAHRFHPRFVGVGDEATAQRLRQKLHHLVGTEVLAEANERLAALEEADVVLSAVVGAAGLGPALAAAEAGKRLALANKEALVMAGHLVMEAARRAGRRAEVESVTLTASGGPFYRCSAEELSHVTAAQALEHPTWKMGPKVTIDSATLMNKALEVIEASWLFGLGAEQIRILIHPQSIVHSMVTFVDGSTIAQLGTPDMQTPIQYALTSPARRKGLAAALDLGALGRLTFEEPDLERFPALRLGFAVARMKGTSGAVLNAANEVAVAAFRSGRLAFSDIVNVVGRTLNRHTPLPEPDLPTVLAADHWAREEAERCLIPNTCS